MKLNGELSQLCQMEVKLCVLNDSLGCTLHIRYCPF